MAAESPKVSARPAVLIGMTNTVPPLSGAAKAELLRRAQVIARLRHPNLVRMLQLPAGGGLVPMLTGLRRLADFTLPVGTFKRFDLEQVVRLLLDAMNGLGELHQAPLGDVFVHGEVSPVSIFVSELGTAKLLPLTPAHLTFASRAPSGYMAPELLRGSAVDQRADVFSVGVMLWEALAGRRLFPEPSASAVAAALAQPLPLIDAAERVAWARPLLAIAERALHSEPELRWASVRELANAVSRAVGGHLATAAGSSWQDEAPTPVLKPRLHFPPLRTVTPQAMVVDLSPVASSVPATPAAAHVTDSESSDVPEPVVRKQRWPRVAALGGGVVLAAGLLWTQHPGHPVRGASAAGALPATEIAPALGAGLPLGTGTSPPARAAVASQTTSEPVSAAAPAPSSPASASGSGSAAPPSPLSSKVKRPRAPRAPRALPAADYGI